jgi:hypothetical protein
MPFVSEKHCLTHFLGNRPAFRDGWRNGATVYRAATADHAARCYMSRLSDPDLLADRQMLVNTARSRASRQPDRSASPEIWVIDQ